MVESKKELEIKEHLDQYEPSAISSKNTDKKESFKMSILYALLFDCLLIFGCISFISLFYIIGGIFLNPLLIFGSLVIILLFALIETMSLVEKNASNKKKAGEKSYV